MGGLHPLSVAKMIKVHKNCGIKIDKILVTSTSGCIVRNMRALSTSTRTGSAITDIALRELDKIASAKGEIDFGISPPPPLKAPVIPSPEKYECSLQKIEEGQTQSIEVADDKLGVIDIVERAYRKAKIERELHDE